MARGVRPSTNTRARASQRRQSDAGRQKRHMYLIQPEVQMRMSIRRKIKRHMKGLS